MAEFQEVMKQWRRMCDKHQCADKQCSAVTYDLICPITISHNGYPCDSGFIDCSPESMAQVEQIVMEWAKEHPEPQYPTWSEWLIDQDIISVEYIARAPSTTSSSAKYEQIVKIQPEFYRPIPADIAEKLGLKPKEANGDG